jgi:hypothetical protein
VPCECSCLCFKVVGTHTGNLLHDGRVHSGTQRSECVPCECSCLCFKVVGTHTGSLLHDGGRHSGVQRSARVLCECSCLCFKLVGTHTYTQAACCMTGAYIWARSTARVCCVIVWVFTCTGLPVYQIRNVNVIVRNRLKRISVHASKSMKWPAIDG